MSDPRVLTPGKVELRCIDCGSSRIVYRSQVGLRYAAADRYRCSDCFRRGRRCGSIPHGRPAHHSLEPCLKCGVRRRPNKALADRLANGKVFICGPCRKRTGVPKIIKKRVPTPSPVCVWFGTGPGPSIVTCPRCGVERWYKKSTGQKLTGFCKVCARMGERSGAWAGGNVVLTCTACAAIKTRRRNRENAALAASGKYRCDPCYKASLGGSGNPAWKGGLSFGPYPTQWTAKLRDMIRARDCHACRLCGAVAGGRRLHVHHIDYDKANLNPSNLITLCHQCHPKTNFNRAHWQTSLAGMGHAP